VTRRLTRRELALMGAGVLIAGSGGAEQASTKRAGVVGVADMGADALSAKTSATAMGDAVKRALGSETAESGLATLFSPRDTVGIKLNCLAGPNLSPRVELVEALVDLLAKAGVQRSRIVVFERSSRELERAGFTLRRGRGPYLCYGTDTGWDRLPSTSGAIGSCFAREVSTTCTALISFGVVKDHDLAGVSAGMKNWYGVIHNPNKYHDNNCDPYVADIMRHPFIADKLRLTVLDGLQGQFQGGPALYSPGLFPLGKVVVSADPVAADLWAWQVIDAERRKQGLPTLAEENREPRFIATADGYGLGVGVPARLEVVSG
jgi:uncharacterized protein (DUF362 family)